MNKPQSFEECVARYGKPWEGPEAYHAFEAAHMGLWTPESFEQCTDKTWPLPWRKIYANQDIHTLLTNTFLGLDHMKLLGELKTFDGCLCVRPIRGRPDRWSIHSFGLAVDFNASENPLGGPARFSTRFLDFMCAAGWTVGAYFKRTDPMHFQWADNC